MNLLVLLSACILYSVFGSPLSERQGGWREGGHIQYGRLAPRGDPRSHGPHGHFMSGWKRGKLRTDRIPPNRHRAHRNFARFGERSEERLNWIKGHLDRLRERRRPHLLEHKRKHFEKIRHKLNKDVHPVLSIQEINEKAEIQEFLFESDIMLAEHQASAIADASMTSSRRRAAGSATGLLWDKTRPIPYTFNDSMDSERVHIVERALDHWEEETCLKFLKDGPGENSIEFFVGDGCYSSLGRIKQWAKQPISIGDGCQMVGIAAHEIIHSLGVFHTQGRVDRDDYIIVNVESIQPQAVSQFSKLTKTENDNKGVIYDYGSIMHYGPNYFWNGKDEPSIVADDVRYQNAIGNRREIQFSDAKMINMMYKCNEHCPMKITCYNGGYVDHKDCTRCKCPEFFRGKFCQTSKILTNLKDTEIKTIELESEPVPKSEVFTTDNVDYDSYYKSEPEVIKAISGKRMNVTLVDFPSTPQYCYATCRYAGIEIVDGNFENSGFLYCCNSNKGITITSSTNRIGIRAWAAPGVQLKYKVKVSTLD